MSSQRTTRQQEIAQQLASYQLQLQNKEAEYETYKRDAEAKLQAQKMAQDAQAALFADWKQSQMQSLCDVLKVQMAELVKQFKAQTVPQNVPEKKRPSSRKRKAEKKAVIPAPESEAEEEEEEESENAEKKRKVEKKEKKELQRKLKETNFPKRPSSAYIFFTKEKQPELKAQMQGQNPEKKQAEITKDVFRQIGTMWQAMTKEARKLYEHKWAEDKKRYEAELAEWKLKNAELAASLPSKKHAPKKSAAKEDAEMRVA